MDQVIKNVLEIPGEFLRVAKQQIVGPNAMPEEKNQQQTATAAKKKFSNYLVNDQKVASQKISQIRQQLLEHSQQKTPTAGPKIPEKPKLPPLAVRNMYSQSAQTGERKISDGG